MEVIGEGVCKQTWELEGSPKQNFISISKSQWGSMHWITFWNNSVHFNLWKPHGLVDSKLQEKIRPTTVKKQWSQAPWLTDTRRQQSGSLPGFLVMLNLKNHYKNEFWGGWNFTISSLQSWLYQTVHVLKHRTTHQNESVLLYAREG